MRRFDIIGAGMGTRETLTGEAAQALVSAEMVFATERLAEICEKAQICVFRACGTGDRVRSGENCTAGFGRCWIFQRRRKTAGKAARAWRSAAVLRPVKYAVSVCKNRNQL